jgi:hypothetical protein
MPRIQETIIVMLSLLVLFAASGCRNSEYVLPEEYKEITDNGGGTGTTTWTSNNNYLLDGIVFVNDGQTLTIEAGTVIRAKTGQDINASALVVARGGKIIAEGTADNPIIFTVQGDDLEGSVPIESNGLWGGVIILGSAPVNSASGENFIEGIPPEEPRAVYGGNIENDNSGILRYVSIRHGGTSLGEGNEINGLTLGGVGKETTIEYVEVISNRDDGFEFFGGTVNVKYLLSAYCGDDAFDFDLGYTGNAQFLIGLQAGSTGDLLIELSANDGFPGTRPVIANATLIGRGMDEDGQTGRFDNGSAGTIVNSVILHQRNGIDIEYSGNSLDSYQQFLDGHINILNNIFYRVGNNSALQILGVFSDNIPDVTEQDSIVSAYFRTSHNILENPGIEYNPQTIDIMNLVPANSNIGEVAKIEDPWFETPNFIGAMKTTNWLLNWSLLASMNLLK